METLPDDASDIDIRSLVLSDHSTVRQKFVDAFPTDVEKVVSALSRAYAMHRHLERTIEVDKRAAYVLAYAYAAFNALLSSTNLFLCGLQLPAGNLMRHYGEASAMALLCSHPDINAFELLEDNDETFPYHKALELVARGRNRKLLDLKGKEWKTFREIAQFYNRFSHASLFSVASHFVFAHPGMLAVLGEYDADKVSTYGIELARRRSGAQVLADMIYQLSLRMPQKAKDDGPDATPRIAE